MAKKTTESVVIASAQSQIDSFLKDNAKYHFNFVPVVSYKVPGGSLKLNIEMGGGLRPGVTRFSGITEGGKTSCALSFARNFQTTIPNGHVVYFKSEGRLSEDMLARSGIDQSPEKFRVVKTNIYEVVGSLITQLINNNPGEVRYFFIIDSMDSLNAQDDINKTLNTADKVAGTSALTATFLKKMSLPITELGHVCIMISQVRSKIVIDTHAKREHQTTNASGGNAPLHYSDWILEFQHHDSKDDKILSTEAPEKIIGHWCEIIFRKSMNEKTGSVLRYPIKYGRTNGSSVWVEREIVDLMIMFELIKKKGSWLFVDETVLSELKIAGLECVDKLQGLDNFYQYFEDNPALTKHFQLKFQETLQKTL